MLSRSIKTTLIAGFAILASAGASLAAPFYGYIEDTARVRAYHSVGSPTVNWVDEGDRVQIIGEWGNWYKVKVPGPDGWVRKSLVAFPRHHHDWDEGDDWDWPRRDPGVSSSFCLNNDNAQFCFGVNN